MLVRIIDQDGLQGITEDDITEDRMTVVAQFDNGHRVMIPRQVLISRDDDSYYLPVSVATLHQQTTETAAGTLVIPLIEETAQVSIQDIVKGTVRIAKTVEEEQLVIDEPLLDEQVEVERVAINEYVEAPVNTREEGDTTIVPIYEEVLVVEKRLLLREEVRITRRRLERHDPQEITVRREQLNVERIPHTSTSETPRNADAE